MRVDMLTEQLLAPVPGGTGRYTAEVCAALAAGAPPGSSVQGWTAWHRDVSAAAVPGAPPPRRLPLPRRALTLAWEHGVPVRPSGGDLVHAPTLLAPPRGRRPLVVTVHDAVPWTHPETLTPRGARWHRRMAERTVPSADAVVVPTHAVARELSSFLSLPARVVVTGAGVGEQLGSPADADERRRRLGVPEGEYVLTVATLEPRKGLDVLLAALAERPGSLPPLVIAGQAGWGGVRPEALAAELGLPAGAVRPLGRLSDADLAAVLHGATVLAAPSRAEGFGLPVLEAMVAGVPVVSSDAPALVEVGGGATVVTPVGDPARLAAALREVVSDAALRRSLAYSGRRRSADFSWASVGAQLWELYASLV
ncbi:MAG TPA: glycosyltransferase family 1 protein [Blastococcus sp.]|nr:glycosyltransferase family 1 protein [Blastococcus sp.]